LPQGLANLPQLQQYCGIEPDFTYCCKEECCYIYAIIQHQLLNEFGHAAAAAALALCVECV